MRKLYNIFITAVYFFLLSSLNLIAAQCPSGMVELPNGTPCINDYGCDMQATGYKCYRSTCCKSYSNNGIPNQTPKCTVPGAQVEYQNGVPVNCMYTACLPGFTCEYSNYNGGQYICCSNRPGVTLGKVRFYPNTNTPLQCFSPQSCREYPDTPNCVLSQVYGFNVCCSTPNC